MRWPGNIAPESVREQVVSGTDLFPTLLAAAGAPAVVEIDGVDLWPVIRDAGRSLPREELCWHYPHYHHQGIGPAGAIRVGDFKLIEWFEPALQAGPFHHQHPLELFDLTVDPGETRDLANAEPERAAAMLRRLQAWRRSVGAQEMRPNPAYDPTAPTVLAPPVDS